ncbi:hypothetical protein ACFQ2M_37170 [Kitasatospora saccharophila]|uniref:hypothetical protein n=1 Tax=Kitasatospora saccharophila TaxID=407973 RepID=UPI0036353957
MTLHLSQPPAGALRAALSALAPEAELSPSSATVLRHSAGRPRPLLALSVHALRGPAPRLAGAECTGWRFLLSESSPPRTRPEGARPRRPGPERPGPERPRPAGTAAARVAAAERRRCR